MGELKTNHSKHLILYHLIFVAKYRRKIFANRKFGEDVKVLFSQISKKYDFEIDTIDLDYSKPDHVHILVRSCPRIAPYSFQINGLGRIMNNISKTFSGKRNICSQEVIFVHL